jgi:CRP-like cAMP-binding protein
MPVPAFVGALMTRFPELNPAEAQSLATHARCKTLKRDEPLLQASEFWRDAFWVERGALRLFYIDADGAESNKNFHLEDAMIWPVAPFLRDEPVSFFVTALEQTVVHCLPYEALEKNVHTMPSWTALQLKALSILVEDKMRREQTFLQHTARQRYEALLQMRPDWAQRIPLRHLASYLGMTDVSLSRLRAEMGLIAR